MQEKKMCFLLRHSQKPDNGCSKSLAGFFPLQQLCFLSLLLIEGSVQVSPQVGAAMYDLFLQGDKQFHGFINVDLMIRMTKNLTLYPERDNIF